MFVKRRERSVRWEAGYKPPEPGHADDDSAPKFVRPEASTAQAQADAAAASTSGDMASPPPAPLPLTSFVFAPKLPDTEKLDPEKLDALSAEELERVLLMEKKTTHTNIAPQVNTPNHNHHHRHHWLRWLARLLSFKRPLLAADVSVCLSARAVSSTQTSSTSTLHRFRCKYWSPRATFSKLPKIFS